MCAFELILPEDHARVECERSRTTDRGAREVFKLLYIIILYYIIAYIHIKINLWHSLWYFIDKKIIQSVNIALYTFLTWWVIRYIYLAIEQ